MAKKRKSIATSLDEVDRTLYASFCTAANSLSQLYTHAMNHQKLSFNAGERHALEKLYQWIWRQQEGGSRVGTVDVLNYIQVCLAFLTFEYATPTLMHASVDWDWGAVPVGNKHITDTYGGLTWIIVYRSSYLLQNELDYSEEPSMSPRAPLQQQSQPVMHVPGSGFLVTSASSGQTIAAQGLRPEHCENQSKNSVFSNALSSPVRRSLQHYQIGEGGCYTNGLSMGNGNRNTEPGFLHQQQSRDSNAVSSNDSVMDMHAD
ncbi:hypothetical protein Fmac_016171 [Flemingia macrophylla]|uniref:Uncharacterized protein n=1 Tax=Flemingia macrophylla TaxID=520843 RepID=A0ABD1MGP2_9FABA